MVESLPKGALIGIIGDDGSGQQQFLERAPAAVTGLDAKDALTRAAAVLELDQRCRNGETILLASHDLDWLAALADEIWWIKDQALAARGDPREVVEKYRRHLVAERTHRGLGKQVPLPPSLRQGDGRAELLGIETLNAQGQQVAVWRTGEPAAVRVTVRFHEGVNDPVVGIMIRTRIGFEVYGTNSGLEKTAIGPRRPGDEVRVTYTFTCHLCPGEYAITAASHDPDGVWHDWLQDGVAVSVADYRYTAGVACLRSTVAVQSLNNER